MKRISYAMPREAFKFTAIIFAIQCITEVAAKHKPEYEWVFLASACALAASVLWVISCIVWNIWVCRDK